MVAGKTIRGGEKVKSDAKVSASRIKQKTPSKPMTRLNSASEEKHDSPGDSFSSKFTDSGEGSDSEDDDGIMALAGWASNKSNQSSTQKRNVGKDISQTVLHRKNFYQNLDVETDAIVNALCDRQPYEGKTACL